MKEAIKKRIYHTISHKKHSQKSCGDLPKHERLSKNYKAVEKIKGLKKEKNIEWLNSTN